MFCMDNAQFSEKNVRILIPHIIMLMTMKVLEFTYTRNKYKKVYVQRQKHIWGPSDISAP